MNIAQSASTRVRGDVELPSGFEPLDFAHFGFKNCEFRARAKSKPARLRAELIRPDNPGGVGGSNKTKKEHQKRHSFYTKYGAAQRIRTADLFLTKEVLCLLS